MKILVSGASGLIGSALRVAASPSHLIIPLVRRKDSPDSIYWNPTEGHIDTAALEGIEAVVHLAGESIAGGRWTPARKAAILGSRVSGTTLLSSALARLKRPPQVLLSASAIGYYGNRGDELLREDSAPGNDFLADVCRQWEQATAAASQAGIRVVHLRSGIVLARNGGALPQMALPFKLGVGGKVGSGAQYMSWIHIEDEVRAILHCLAAPAVEGAVNGVGPSPVRNVEFAKTLGSVLSRPSLLPLPAFAARLVLGEMADSLLLASQRVEPAALLSSGFVFRHPELKEALRSVLKS